MTIHIAALTCPTLLAIAIIAPGCSSSSPSADTGPDTSDDATADAPADAMPADAAPDAKALPDNPASRYPQIADVRTIGGSPSADYPTFSAAIADLASQAVPAGGVLFRVEPGSYPERFTVPALKGSDAQRPVVFAAALTDADQRVVVRGTGSDASEDAMITLDGCDHVTFDSIDVVDGGSDATDRVERGYYITGSETDGATHNTLRDAAIRLGGGGGPVSPLTKGSSCGARRPMPRPPRRLAATTGSTAYAWIAPPRGSCCAEPRWG